MFFAAFVIARDCKKAVLGCSQPGRCLETSNWLASSHSWLIRSLAVGLLCFTCGLGLELSAQAATPEELIHELAVKSGHAPTLEDFVGMLNSPEGAKLDRGAVRSAWYALRQHQKPEVALTELMKLIAERRDAIKTLHCSVELLKEDFTHQPLPVKASSTYQFAHSADVFYVREEMLDEAGMSTGFSTRAYEGKDVRHYYKLPKQTEAVGGILLFKSKHQFFPHDSHPLNLLMMLDSPSVWKRPFSPVDLAAWVEEREESLILFEHPEVVDKVPCTIIATSDVKAYLEVGRSCILRRIDYFSFTTPAGAMKPVRALAGRRTFENFVDAGSGLMLPQLVKNERYLEAAVTRRETAKITWGSVNQPLLATLTKDVIPKGTRVLDTVQNKIYREGIPGSDE